MNNIPDFAYLYVNNPDVVDESFRDVLVAWDWDDTH